MALRGTLNHWKTRRLARLLNIPPCYALGVLETLWHVTAQQMPNGAIGRMSDEEIADQLGYPDDPQHLIRSLVDAGFLDEVKPHRLIVHDWHKHRDDHVDYTLFRRGEKFANGAVPTGRKCDKAERAEIKERFFAEPAKDLFQQPQVVAAEAKQERIREQEAAPNVVAFSSAQSGAVRRLPEPVPEPVPVPEPAPAPAASDAPPPVETWTSDRKEQRALAQSRSLGAGNALDRAARHVVTACGMSGLTATRLQPTVWMALDAFCRQQESPPEQTAMETAERMVRNYGEWSRAGPLVNYPKAPHVFFRDGHWQGDATWRYDEAMLRDMHSRRNVAIGL